MNDHDLPPPARRPALERRPPQPGRPALEIHRSPRRYRSAAVALRDDRLVVRLPAGIAVDEEEQLIAQLVRKATGRARAEALGGDAALQERADVLADRYLDGVRATTVRWSGRMNSQHGSCTPATGTIRISRELASHPSFVLEYVLVHELAHLQVSGHSAAFRELVARYPEAERARGYLEGYAAGRVAAVTPQLFDDGQTLGSSSS